MQFPLCLQQLPAFLPSVPTIRALPHQSLRSVMEELINNQSLLRHTSFWLSSWSRHGNSFVAATSHTSRPTMSSLMLFSLLPFPMLAVVLAIERLTKPALQAER
jgi:hypothetical protein